MATPRSLLQRFEALEIAPQDFHHEEHVRVAFAMLRQHDFVDACARYARTIRAMAAGAGAPEKFNTTITFAFMSLVAERAAKTPSQDIEEFLAANPDLLDKHLLRRWYSDKELSSADARARFILPDAALNSGPA
ncbi:MAG: hypothetical protein AAF610_03670 [Pseudomonadota bacterium]